jgi:3-phenylpropionate/trans-cinnamate dioxygenase ferredoxin reductase subunit
MSKPLVIIGAGLASAKAVEQLRASGCTDPIVVYGDEPHLPYERPPLSKGYLTGEASLGDATVHEGDWYDRHDVELHLGVQVTEVDLAARVVTATDGSQGYERLLLATGAAPRHLPLADDSGAVVSYLRTAEDSQRLKGRLLAGASVVIVGGGWIGLEVAAAARAAGCAVTVLESLELPLVRVLGPEVAERFVDLHRAHGVDVRSRVDIASIDSDGAGASVRLEDGGTLTCDVLVVGVGVSPNTALAEQAGLDVDNGVLVDEHLRTSDPWVFAAGDVANAYHPRLGRRIRVEHWDNAIGQGEAAARSMLGELVSYERYPYFFSDQYDLGMEYVGHVGPEGYDEVSVENGAEEGSFTALWSRGGTVVAGMHANDWDAMDRIRRAVEGADVREG